MLTDGGPLVTDINVDVGTNGIKTSIKMDLFTPKFGKIKKQHEVLLDKVVRERQKLRDQKNLLIRNHAIQEATNVEYTAMFDKYAEIVEVADFTSKIQQGDTGAFSNMLVATAYKPEVTNEVTLDGNPRVISNYGQEVSIMSMENLTEGIGMFPDRASRDKGYFNSAGGDISDFFVPSSEEKHPHMTNSNQTFIDQKKTNSTKSNLQDFRI